MKINGRGFYLNKNFNYKKTCCLSKERENFFITINENINKFIQFKPYKLSIEEWYITKIGKLKNLLIRGELYFDSIESDLINAIEFLIEQDDYSKIRNIKGDYCIVIESIDKLWVINSRCSQYEIFWNYNGQELIVSNYHYYVAPHHNINNHILPLLCYGEDVNIYNNLNILKRNSILKLDYKTRKCSIKKEFVKCKKVFSNTADLDEIGETVHTALLNSVKYSLQGKGKCALMLSGGIDSGAVAKCLQECNADVIFYTWSSKNKNASEFQYADKVAKKLGYEIVELVLDEPPNNYIFPKSYSKFFPHTNVVSAWWEVAFERAYKDNVSTFFSGHNGAIIGGSNGLFFKNTNFWSSYKIVNFLENFIRTKITYLPVGNRYNNPYRGFDIFSKGAKKTIANYWSLEVAPHMFVDHYSYLINFCEKYNISFAEAYLDSDIFDIAYSIPKRLRKRNYGGFTINKIPLRYSMINKLPHEVVSRCHVANLGYINSVNFKNNYKSVLMSFDKDSELVKRDIINLKNIHQLLNTNNYKLIDKNINSIYISFMVDNWLKIQNS